MLAGAQYHHNPDYMESLRLGRVTPFHFHMCWTLNKDDKIRNFQQADMWYIDSNYSDSNRSARSTSGHQSTSASARSTSGHQSTSHGASAWRCPLIHIYHEFILIVNNNTNSSNITSTD